MIHDGRFLQSEFVFEQDGKKSTGLGLVGFDATTGQFTTVWTDSRSTRMSLRQSQQPFSGKEIVLQSRSLKRRRGLAAVAHNDEAGSRRHPDHSSSVRRRGRWQGTIDDGARHDAKVATKAAMNKAGLGSSSRANNSVCGLFVVIPGRSPVGDSRPTSRRWTRVICIGSCGNVRPVSSLSMCARGQRPCQRPPRRPGCARVR